MRLKKIMHDMLDFTLTGTQYHVHYGNRAGEGPLGEALSGARGRRRFNN